MFDSFLSALAILLVAAALLWGFSRLLDYLDDVDWREDEEGSLWDPSSPEEHRTPTTPAGRGPQP